MNRLALAAIVLLILFFVVVALGFGTLIYQGRQVPKTNAPYVALGSSFAAGAGLGPRALGSPFLCGRSSNGYPQQLARLLGLAITDMSCGGATVANVLKGGQFFMGPQIDAIGPDTKMVTLTAGGNDVGYIGDLLKLSYAQRSSITGFLARHVSKGAKPAQDRDFALLQTNLTATLREIKRRAPHARVVVVTYPAVLPPVGTCPQLGLTESDAALMKGVADELAQVTRNAAQAAGATIVDMASLSVGHDACSAVPWINGARPAHGTPFHPTLAGAEATARQIMNVLNVER